MPGPQLPWRAIRMRGTMVLVLDQQGDMIRR